MLDSYTTSEDLQEPSQATYPAPSAQHIEDIPATEDTVLLADLPSSFDAQEEPLSILHHRQNFFVLAYSYSGGQPMPSRITDVASQEEEWDGEVKAAIQTSTVSLEVPVRSGTLFNTRLERFRLKAGVAGALLPLSLKRGIHQIILNGIATYLQKRIKAVKATLVAIPVPAWLESIIIVIGLMASSFQKRIKAAKATLVAIPVPAWLESIIIVIGLMASSFQKRIKAVKATLVVLRVPAWLESIIVVIGLMASFAAHAINLFNFPRYELDEGTYMSSAWAIMNGLITPYTYGYGHPPIGWIQIAAWIEFTGGFFTFGNAINSGRVLMVLYALGGSLLVYLIVHRMSGSRSASLLALVLFSLSPISLVYQRQVFLDNIGTFWLLLSLYLIVAGNSRLLYIVFAGFSFGISLLSKETFIVFMPAMIYGIWLYTTKYQRKFVFVTFTYTVVALGSSFVLMAILKGELFPYSWHLPWDHHVHFSMLDTLVQQAQRGQDQGKFSDSWYTWTQEDPFLIALSIITIIFTLIAGWWDRKQLFLSLLGISYWLLLARGGVVHWFYIIPLIPPIALNAAIAINTIVTWIGRLLHFPLTPVLLIFSIIVVIVSYDLQYAGIAFTQHPTSAQTDAMVWIRNNVPRNDMVVINSYLYMDLRQPGGEGVGDGATYPFAHVYWNVAYDPELHDQLLQDNWDRIDYIVADSEMLHDITTVGGPMLLIGRALQHSIKRAEFRADDRDSKIVISIYQVMHAQVSPTVY